MNENKQKEKHTLRNVLITLLVLCVLGGGGYFGYVKYQEYQEEQVATAEYQEKVDEALKGVSEEDAAKLTDKQLKILAEATNMKGQEKALNNYGIMADMNERYKTVGNFCPLYKDTLVEEDTQVNASEAKIVCKDGEERPFAVQVSNTIYGTVLYDRKYGGDTLAFEDYINYVYEDGTVLTYYDWCEIDGDELRELVNNYKVDPDTVEFKSYDIYWFSDGNNAVQMLMVNDKVPDGEPRFVVQIYNGNEPRYVLY